MADPAKPVRSANETRADQAFAAVVAHANATASQWEHPVPQTLDLLTNLAHLFTRLGLDMQAATQHAMKSAAQEATEVDPACVFTGKGEGP